MWFSTGALGEWREGSLAVFGERPQVLSSHGSPCVKFLAWSTCPPTVFSRIPTFRKSFRDSAPADPGDCTTGSIYTTGSGAHGRNLCAESSRKCVCSETQQAHWGQTLFTGGVYKSLSVAIFVVAKNRERGTWNIFSYTYLQYIFFGDVSVEIFGPFLN